MSKWNTIPRNRSGLCLCGQPARHGGVEGELLEVDKGNIELARQGLADLVFADKRRLDQHATEPAPAALLQLQRFAQLLLRNSLVLDKKVTDADFFWFRHCRPYSPERSA